MKRFEIVCNANITEDCIKTEKELREWANEIRENEGLKDVQPNFTETYDSNDILRREGYIDDLWSCVEFLEEYDYSINEINR